MKLRTLKLVPLLLSALLFAGCESIPGMSDDEAAGSEAAPVTEAVEGGQGSTMSAAEERPAWSGSPLENPESPLYTKVIYFDYDVDQVRSDYYQVVVAHGEYLATNPAITVTLEAMPMSAVPVSTILHWVSDALTVFDRYCWPRG